MYRKLSSVTHEYDIGTPADIDSLSVYHEKFLGSFLGKYIFWSTYWPFRLKLSLSSGSLHIAFNSTRDSFRAPLLQAYLRLLHIQISEPGQQEMARLCFHPIPAHVNHYSS